MKDRVFPLEGVHNFRRFGGFDTAGKAKVSDRLYRSGQFSRATGKDRETLAGLGVRLVADLRRPRERQAEPSFWGEHTGVRVLESDHAGHDEAPHLVFLRESDLSLDSIREFMIETYRRLPFDAGNKWVFEQGLRHLAEAGPEDGFVVHCAAGKDRTGLFCALLLTELGVEQETVRADYLFTNEAVDFDRIVPAMTRRIETEMGRSIGTDELRAFLGVDAAYLDAAMDAIGEPREYLRGELGLEESVLDALKERLLA
ncbi:tyrosine-protein phosphatase [Marinicauda algicola]|uniref:Tyrosine-protein phosphatase n=1 Tax=Marinicauda algicola TaxID=2029849 RepID=A0A4S2GZR0_9PROT|nr:tyrosine-protein phosphatase [Marinicauda algicola]TGY88421.1 tyrosine-protein phosphatase [Marinicauda algicola]